MILYKLQNQTVDNSKYHPQPPLRCPKMISREYLIETRTATFTLKIPSYVDGHAKKSQGSKCHIRCCESFSKLQLVIWLYDYQRISICIKHWLGSRSVIILKTYQTSPERDSKRPQLTRLPDSFKHNTKSPNTCDLHFG